MKLKVLEQIYMFLENLLYVRSDCIKVLELVEKIRQKTLEPVDIEYEYSLMIQVEIQIGIAVEMLEQLVALHLLRSYYGK